MVKEDDLLADITLIHEKEQFQRRVIWACFGGWTEAVKIDPRRVSMAGFGRVVRRVVRRVESTALIRM